MKYALLIETVEHGVSSVVVSYDTQDEANTAYGILINEIPDPGFVSRRKVTRLYNPTYP